MNEENFRDLLRLAIGNSRSQADFAKQAEISPEHLNRMLKHPEKYTPSAATLRKIADASNGRVSLNRLEKACGITASKRTILGVNIPDVEPVGEFYDAKQVIIEYKKGIIDFSGKATRYDSIHDVLETVEILYGRAKFSYLVEDEKEFAGRGHSGAEMTANITVKFATDEYLCEFGFVLFFCETKKGGIIFSDAAFDLLTLNEFDHPIGGRKLLEISTRENEDRSRYQTVYFIDKLA